MFSPKQSYLLGRKSRATRESRVAFSERSEMSFKRLDLAYTKPQRLLAEKSSEGVHAPPGQLYTQRHNQQLFDARVCPLATTKGVIQEAGSPAAEAKSDPVISGRLYYLPSGQSRDPRPGKQHAQSSWYDNAALEDQFKASFAQNNLAMTYD